MLTIAYLANQFPAAVEPYVGAEISELRQKGVRVIAGSVKAPKTRREEAADWRPSRLYAPPSCPDVLCLQPIRLLSLLRALLLITRRWQRISDLVLRVIAGGPEPPMRRLKAILHTWLGAYYAVMLEEHGIEHIHIHHGYFGSWVGMVAARLLGVSFSLTLHGSDLLLSGHYLEAKLANCHFCITISKYNRDHILRQFPGIDPGKIVVCRLGVDTLETTIGIHPRQSERLSLLTVGRLHEVKDHAFLVRACAHLRQRGLNFECAIAGEGPERKRLELLIQENNLRDRVTLLGHVEPPQMDRLYQRADLIVLTSRSEGIPLVLMEAMANGKIVLAPAITGIPELVIHATTGFLYRAGALDEFVNATIGLNELLRDEHKSENNRLQWIRHAARAQILHNFDRRKNLGRFADQFLERMVPLEPVTSSAASLLQIVASGSSEMKAS